MVISLTLTFEGILEAPTAEQGGLGDGVREDVPQPYRPQAHHAHSSWS